LEQIRHQVRDIIGIRIITHFLSDIPVVIRKLRTLTDLDIGIEQELEDYIAKPQATGYRSLHINALYRKTVPCEIQIRTSLQDGWATKSHLLAYKVEDIPPRWQRHFRLLSDQLHLADAVARNEAINC
jgi:ppGpp synthetase/RelA/SpoT-type nucleotidyltranferase